MTLSASPSPVLVASPHSDLAAPTTPSISTAAAIIAAAGLLLASIEQGHSIDARILRTAMETAFGGSDADGHWDWKTAYDACEVTQILFLRKFGTALAKRFDNPAALLAKVGKVSLLFPTHTRRSESSQSLQQFSTPVGLGLVAAVAAAITPADVVLEPSAGSGLLAVHAERAGAALVLNEYADTRADLLERLFTHIAHGGAKAAGGGAMAYSLGSAGKSGASGMASGIGAVGQAAAGAATSPLRKAADSMKSSFKDGARGAVTATGGTITGGAPEPSEPEAKSGAAQPAWAKAMKNRQTISHGLGLAAHTLRSGDGGGAGSSVDVTEKE